jgi:DNA replication licensing factor MCM3
MLLLCFTVLPLGSDVDILATSDPNVDKEEEGDTPIYDKYDKKLHGENKGKS